MRDDFAKQLVERERIHSRLKARDVFGKRLIRL